MIPATCSALSLSGGSRSIELRLDGFMANALQPWGLLAAPVSLVVRDPDQTPYCAESRDPLLSRVLTEQWPHAGIIDAMP